TGGHANANGITEISIHIFNGIDTVEVFETLINPRQPIPKYIQAMTGITNEMVASAPIFEAVAEEIFLRLKDKLFIAHNVAFDYGFLRKELGNVGISFKAPLMCSVRLSRTLYPNAESHSLENIILRHNIAVKYRHRALDDAQATYRFLQIAEHEHGVDNFRSAFHKQFQYGDLPLNIDPDIISQIPRTAGIYYLWSSDNKLLYVGKGNNIRAEVFAQFLSGEKSPLESKLATLTADVTWEITPGELSPIILHSKKVHLLKPSLNKRAQTVTSLCSIFLENDNNGRLSPRVVFSDEIASNYQRLYGLFTSEKQALKEIKTLFSSMNLCLNLVPSQTSNNLFACENVLCTLCNGTEHYLKHNIRMQKAFEQIALHRWPFQTAIAIEESSKHSETAHIILSNWCLLGIAKSSEDYEEIFLKTEAQLDRSIYKYLSRVLKNSPSMLKFQQLNKLTILNIVR
ncbi:MAG: hypothetical protein EOO89_03380, partial [Pedobacter sp.]